MNSVLAAPPAATIAPPIPSPTASSEYGLPHRQLLVVGGSLQRDGGQLLEAELERHGYGVHHAVTAHEALAAVDRFDVMLVRSDLGDLDVVELCRRVRAVSSIVLIALSNDCSETDRILTLYAGSDDHLSTPFSVRELLARIEAVLRRATPLASSDVVEVGNLRVDSRSRTVTVDERTVPLTRKEFDLIQFLATRPETVVTRQELMKEVWSDTSGLPSRTIDTHVSTLRSKVGDTVHISTVRGVGFRLLPSYATP